MLILINLVPTADKAVGRRNGGRFPSEITIV